MSMSRVVRRRDASELARENFGTIIRPRSAPRPLDARQLFVERWPAIRAATARYHRQGVVLMAFDHEPQPAAELWLEASLDRTRAAIVGRHVRCDMLVPMHHDALALRHLAVLVRAVDLHETRLRVLDLRTGSPFVDETGRELDAVAADAPLFLRLGALSLVALRTPEPGGWPDDAERAFATLPERVFVEELSARARPLEVVRPLLARAADETVVRSRLGPVGMDADLCPRGVAPVGALTLTTPNLQVRHRVSAESLERGVLLGRYDRCQVGLAAAFGSLSRVHLLLVQDGDDLLAIDTASTNGTFIGGTEHKISTVASGDRIALSDDVRIEWHTEA